MSRNYEVIGEITGIETIAIGRRIRELPALQERFGRGRWCKLKGIAQVCLADGTRFAVPSYTGTRRTASDV